MCFRVHPNFNRSKQLAFHSPRNPEMIISSSAVAAFRFHCYSTDETTWWFRCCLESSSLTNCVWHFKELCYVYIKNCQHQQCRAPISKFVDELLNNLLLGSHSLIGIFSNRNLTFGISFSETIFASTLFIFTISLKWNCSVVASMVFEMLYWSAKIKMEIQCYSNE